MAEDAKIETPNVMVERNSKPSRTWNDYVITAPGYRVYTPVSTTMAVFAGVALGAFISFMVGMWVRDGIAFLIGIVGCGFFAFWYAKLVNRLVGTDGLVAKGKAVKVLDCHRNRLVVAAARRNAPAYFNVALRAAELDRIDERLDDREKLTHAERTVLSEELKQGEEELRLMLTQASLVHAAALLDPSDPAIRAAGQMTAAMYQELQEGKWAAYDEDL